jgi:hypothetical protein
MAILAKLFSISTVDEKTRATQREKEELTGCFVLEYLYRLNI